MTASATPTGSWRAAWTARRSLYLGLGASWLLLCACVLSADRGESVSLGSAAVSSSQSLFTQAGALTHYLRLFFWPTQLSIDYAGWPVARSVAPVLPQLSLVLALAAVALWRVRSNRLKQVEIHKSKQFSVVNSKSILMSLFKVSILIKFYHVTFEILSNLILT